MGANSGGVANICIMAMSSSWEGNWAALFVDASPGGAHGGVNVAAGVMTCRGAAAGGGAGGALVTAVADRCLCAMMRSISS